MVNTIIYIWWSMWLDRRSVYVATIAAGQVGAELASFVPIRGIPGCAQLAGREVYVVPAASTHVAMTAMTHRW